MLKTEVVVTWEKTRNQLLETDMETRERTRERTRRGEKEQVIVGEGDRETLESINLCPMIGLVTRTGIRPIFRLPVT